jgi:cytoskeletal protein RodZ
MSTAPSAEQAQSTIQTEQNTISTSQMSGNVLPSVTAAPLSNTSTTATAATSLPPIAMPTAEDQLVLNLSKSSGVTVQDSTGKTLVSGQQASGEPLTLTGISPFSITLDDAATVSLSLNGESVDLKPYTVQGKAAFRLSR